MASIHVSKVREFGTTFRGSSNNTRHRCPALYGLPDSIYKSPWDYIDALLHDKDGGRAGAIMNTIKFNPEVVNTMCSLAEYGQLQDIILDKDGRLVEGFGRVEAIAFGLAVAATDFADFENMARQAKGNFVFDVEKEDNDGDWFGFVHDYATGIRDNFKGSLSYRKTADERLNQISMESNTRRKAVNPLDLGYYLQERFDEGQDDTELGRIMWPNMALHLSTALVHNHRLLTTCSDKVQARLRAGTISIDSALKTLEVIDPEKPKVKPAKYTVSAKVLNHALREVETSSTSERLAKIFGSELLNELGEDFIKALRILCVDSRKVEPKKVAASQKPKKKAELEAELADLRKKLASKSNTTINIDLDSNSDSDSSFDSDSDSN